MAGKTKRERRLALLRGVADDLSKDAQIALWEGSERQTVRKAGLISLAGMVLLPLWMLITDAGTKKNHGPKR